MPRSETRKQAVREVAAPLGTRSTAADAASGVGEAPASGTRVIQRSVTDLFEVRVAMFDVPPSEADLVASAAHELASYAQTHEPRTRFFGILRDQDRPGRFVYAAVFDDEEAERTHRGSPHAHRFAQALLAAGVHLDTTRWTGVAGV